MTRLIAVVVFLLCAGVGVNAHAKCDAQKAARNAAMDATLGVSGRCDAEKLAEDAVDDARDKADLDLDKKHKDRKDDREERRKDRKDRED